MPAVGNEKYVQEVIEKLSSKVKSREMIKDGDSFVLKEPRHSYINNFSGKNVTLCLDNRDFLGFFLSNIKGLLRSDPNCTH